MVNNSQDNVMNKPNLFLIGAPKCGTTALAYNISHHKDVFLPIQKEPRFFDASTFYDNPNDYFTKTLEDYLNYYDNTEAKESKYRLDASVFNMYKKESIENILVLSPDAKFIIILRDPVEASISMFHQRLSVVDTSMREISEDFNECWELLEDRKKGQSYPQGCKNKFLFRYDLLYSYQDYVPYLQKRLAKNLFIGFYDEYKNNPEQFFQKLFHFLEIENMEIENKNVNKSMILRKSFLLNLLNRFAKNTVQIRKKLGLLGILNIQKNLISKYKQPINKEVKAKQKVYDFFKPTYDYLKSLQHDKD